MRDWNTEAVYHGVSLRACCRTLDESREIEVERAEAYDEDADAWVEIEDHPTIGKDAESAVGDLVATYRMDGESAKIDAEYERYREARLTDLG